MQIFVPDDTKNEQDIDCPQEVDKVVLRLNKKEMLHLADEITKFATVAEVSDHVHLNGMNEGAEIIVFLKD